MWQFGGSPGPIPQWVEVGPTQAGRMRRPGCVGCEADSTSALPGPGNRIGLVLLAGMASRGTVHALPLLSIVSLTQT